MHVLVNSCEFMIWYVFVALNLFQVVYLTVFSDRFLFSSLSQRLTQRLTYNYRFVITLNYNAQNLILNLHQRSQLTVLFSRPARMLSHDAKKQFALPLVDIHFSAKRPSG